MYAIFACVDDREFYDVCPNGEKMIHLFDSESEANEWAVDYIASKGDITQLDSGEWIVKVSGLTFKTKEEALDCWQESLSGMNWFHVIEVVDHRQLGG